MPNCCKFTAKQNPNDQKKKKIIFFVLHFLNNQTKHERRNISKESPGITINRFENIQQRRRIIHSLFPFPCKQYPKKGVCFMLFEINKNKRYQILTHSNAKQARQRLKIANKFVVLATYLRWFFGFQSLSC